MGVTPYGVFFILAGTPAPCPQALFLYTLTRSSEDRQVLEWPVCGLVKDVEGSQSPGWKSSEPPPRS